MEEVTRAAFASLLFFACSSSDPPVAEPAPPAADAGPEVRVSGLPQTCTRGTKVAQEPPTCNGSETLCARTYDRVTTPMTHNAMSNADDGWSAPNQTHGLAKQLADGIRGFMLDTHYFDSETNHNETERIANATTVDQVYLCHTLCALGKRRLLDGLCDIVKFLDDNPTEVLSIIFETRVGDADLVDTLKAAGLDEYAFTHAPGTPWPTLREMITAKKRLVVFVETGGGEPAWLHPAFTGNIRDTPYSFEQASQFSCALNRGAAGDPLFLVNHWLGRPLANISYAREVNVEAVLGKRVDDCTAEVGRPPTFVGVDFYEVGDLFAVTQRYNSTP
jgi:hypothetical protein